MDKKNLLIIGTGGHAKVVAETAQLTGWDSINFLDEGTKDLFREKKVFHSIEQFKTYSPKTRHAFVAIGHTTARKRWHGILRQEGFELSVLIHPTACVSADCMIAKGSFIAAKAVVGPGSRIGAGVILNVGSILEHDASIGDFSHLSPGVIVCGGVKIGEETTIGPGAVIEKLAVVSSQKMISANSVFCTP